MSFNFNESDQKDNQVSIFNNGKSGVAKNVTIKPLKKGKDYEGESVPHYKLQFTDEGGEIEMGFYYLDESSHNPQYGTFDNAVKKQWKRLAGILTECGEKGTGEFKTPEDMLDTMMSKLKTTVTGKTFNVFCNYGHVNTPRKYLQIRSWTPFLELAGTEPTTLKATRIDQLERLVPNTSESEDIFPPVSEKDEEWTD